MSTLGIGQGLAQGVQTAGQFLMTWMKAKMQNDRQQKMLDYEQSWKNGLMGLDVNGNPVVRASNAFPAAPATDAPNEPLSPAALLQQSRIARHVPMLNMSPTAPAASSPARLFRPSGY